MEFKTCFKCNKNLPLTSFYKHSRMKDGHLNKCKDCTKSDVKVNYNSNIEDPNFVEKERARGREKFHRLGYGNKYGNKAKESGQLYKNLNRNLRAKGYNMKDKEVHHWNYNLINSGFILSKRFHRRLHQYIEFDPDSKCYTYKDNLLDTSEKHLMFMQTIMEELKIEEEVVEFLI